jgi:tetratricopeptide (TPR) repeat protein
MIKYPVARPVTPSLATHLLDLQIFFEHTGEISSTEKAPGLAGMEPISSMLMVINPDHEKRLTPEQELDLLRAAYRKSPSLQLRSRLCRLLMLDEGFAEIVDLLSAADSLDFRGELTLAQAYISAETLEGNRLAHAATQRALTLAANAAERAGALAQRGKCENRMGQAQAALATLTAALALDPHNRDACKRLAAIELAANRPEAVVELTGSLLAKGANHARIFAASSLAHARSGDLGAAQAAAGFDLFHHTQQLSPPPGWHDIAAFNAALAEELLVHPGMRFDRYGSASEQTWRIENPARPDTPLFKALIAQIIAALQERAVQVGLSPGHAWAAARPQDAHLRNWCVITETTGFENWHVHQFGWLSGVYYVRIPDSITQGTDQGGCLAFGLPGDLAGEAGAAQFGEHLVRPREGMLLTFPSQCYHRTFPHGTGEKRICVAFDLRPA